MRKFVLLAFGLSFFNVSFAEFVQNDKNPAEYKKFRLDLAEMQDIASDTKLKHRVFYEKPSTGPNAVWFDAVKTGDLDAVKAMVNHGQDIEVKDEDSLGQTALLWAAFIGYEDMVDYLLDQGADLWATDKGDVYNALKSAVLGKNTNIVKKIYERLGEKGDLDSQQYESDGETLVMVAASNNRLDTVQYLIENGVDLNKSTTTHDKTMGSYNQSALSYACDRGHKEMQDLLIKNGAINHRNGKPSCE